MLARKYQDRSWSNTRFSATGRSSNATIEKPSGYTALDISSLRAVVGTRQILPLPGAFPNPTLTVHLNFEYRR